MNATANPPAIFGEVLFDCFPDGSAVLGGAPFNVAWHLHGFGLSPLMISCVGEDEHGEQVREKMRAWGMRMDSLQLDSDHPTGRVSIEFHDGEPEYDIVPDQAYDHIDLQQTQSVMAAGQYGLLYHGTLALRNDETRSGLKTFIERCGLPTFVDVNLRKPWWDKTSVVEAVSAAKWVKLNQHELAIITGSSVDTDEQAKSVAQNWFDNHDMQMLIVTQGDRGAVCVSKQGIVEGEPVPVNNLVDTVGAGDSFSAVMISGILNQWPLQQSLNRALAFASAVCEMRGATTSDKSLYQRFLDEWKNG
jgi:fructokinase